MTLHPHFQVTKKEKITRAPRAYDLFRREHAEHIVAEAKRRGINHLAAAAEEWGRVGDKSKWQAMAAASKPSKK